MNDYLLPNYSRGRFFINTFLGCFNKCIYCYIFDQKEAEKVKKNKASLDEVISSIISHPEYKKGKNGSILSFGSWGDPFPNKKINEITIQWLEKLSTLGNPIQICSKNAIDNSTLSRIAASITYPNQILYLSSITTFSHWKIVEPFTISPEERLTILSEAQNLGIPVCLFIKPFIFGITDKETDRFIQILTQNKIYTCIVGVFYLNKNIIKKLEEKNILSKEMENVLFKKSFHHGLVCNPDLEFKTHKGNLLDPFCEKLKRNGIYIFKNTNCVTAWLLKVPHIWKLHQNDNNKLCVKCGNCLP